MTKNFPKTISFSGEIIDSYKTMVNNDPIYVEYLRKEAESKLKMENLSVVNRKIKAESNNPHDYCSLGPYWWKNPNTKDGLPYIRRDGEVNPEVNDPNNFGRLFGAVELLSFASYYLDEEKYGKKAAELIDYWYLNPETKMNEHLNYGQAIPGICNGRGIGLIDCASSYKLFDSVMILHYLGYFSDAKLDALKAWYNKFLDWMLTSEIGIDEDRQHNNHGSWYDVQVISTAIFLDRKVLAERTTSLSFERRILKHIALDGSQPHELMRTKAMGYSIMNLRSLYLLSTYSSILKTKLNFWEQKRNDVYVLKSAIDFLVPYLKDFSTFPYKQIDGKVEISSICPLLKIAKKVYNTNEYDEMLEKNKYQNMFWAIRP